MMWCIQDIIRNILRWVTIHDPLDSNLGIDENCNQLDYRWIFIVPLPFFLYVESLLVNPYSPSFLTLTAYVLWIQQTWTAESEVLHATLPNGALTLLQNRITTEGHENKVFMPLVYRIWRFIFNHYQQLSFNPYNFRCWHSGSSQLYPPSKFRKILQYTGNSVHTVTAHILELEAEWTTFSGVICRGRSWSTHFSVFHMSGPQSYLVIQHC